MSVSLWVRVLFCLFLVNFAALIAYRCDKRNAIYNRGKSRYAQRFRVPEVWLFFLGLIGGWPGGLVGRLWRPRHKTQSIVFRVKFWLTAIPSIMLGFWLLYQLFSNLSQLAIGS